MKLTVKQDRLVKILQYSVLAVLALLAFRRSLTAIMQHFSGRPISINKEFFIELFSIKIEERAIARLLSSSTQMIIAGFLVYLLTQNKIQVSQIQDEGLTSITKLSTFGKGDKIPTMAEQIKASPRYELEHESSV